MNLGDYYGSWRVMQTALGDGLVRAIGVSNFHDDRLFDQIAHNEVLPAVNQIETHPFYQRQDYQGSWSSEACRSSRGGRSPRVATA